MPIGTTVRNLIAEGRIGAALLELRERQSAQVSVSETLLFAELTADATSDNSPLKIAQSLLSSRSLDNTSKVRSFALAGTILCRLGRQAEGLSYLRRACALSEQSDDKYLRCSAGLSVLSSLASWAGPDSASGEIARVRRLVHAAGDSTLASRFRLILVEIEGKRGALDRARQHLAIARALLDASPHLLLNVEYFLRSAAIEVLGSNPTEARHLVNEALRLAEQCGSTSHEVVGRTNLAHLLLLGGEIAAAASQLEVAQERCRTGGPAEVGIVDERMQLSLAKGDLVEAAELEDAVRRMTTGHDHQDDFYALWHRITTIRLLLRANRAVAAVEAARESIPRVERMADRNLLERMKLLAAEGLADTGRAHEGAALRAEVALEIQGQPLEVLGEVSRVAGRLARGHLPAALTHYERAGRILLRVGNVTARGEVALNAGDALQAHAAPGVPVDTPWHDLPSLYDQPRLIGRRLDTSRPLLADPRPSAVRAVEAAAAAFDLAGHPSLMGQELVALLHEATAARAAALIEHTPGAPPRAVVWTGCSSDEAVTLADNPGAIAITLGTERTQSYTLAASPADRVEARSTLAAVQQLARSALALDEARRVERERAALWPEESPEQQLGFIVASESMVNLVKTMRRLAAGNVPVLITGETGTGKELLARALHDTSPRRDKPFVPFNCTAVPRDMLDSQLFGYRRGAFTGAQEAFSGVIRAAAGGTLLLDEIGEIGLDIQPKLLRFLESSEVHPLGEPTPRMVDVRIVAATNRSLYDLVAAGRFREDLYYRLDVVRLEVPPLRERREEIPLLVEHFLDKWSGESHKTGLRIAEETMEYLVLYRWPGNVRELANEVRRMAALAESGAVLMPAHLSPAIAASRRTLPASDRVLDPTELVVRTDQPLAAAVEHLERAMVQQALRLYGHRVEDAARHLGLSRKGLYLKRQRLDIE